MSPNRSFRIPAILFLSSLLFLFALASCEKANKGYRFTGTLSESDSGMVYLVSDTVDSLHYAPARFDSAVLKDGKFEFTGAVPYPIVCLLEYPNEDVIAVFVLENGEIALDTGTNQFGRTVKGSKGEIDFDGLIAIQNEYINSLDETLDSLANVPTNSKKRRDSLAAASYKVDSLAKVAYDKKVLEYVREHSSSYGALYGWGMGELWEEGSTVFARRVFEQFDLPVRNSAIGRKTEKEIQYYESMQAGQPAPELNLKDKDGNLVTLSSYKGKRIIFITHPSGLVPDDFDALTKLTNTVIIANDPDPRLNMKWIGVYTEEGFESPYLPPSELGPWAFAIDENGKIVSKGYEPWKDLR